MCRSEQRWQIYQVLLGWEHILFCENFKCQIYKLQIPNSKLHITNYKLQISIYKLQITNYKFQFTIYKLKIKNYNLEITNDTCSPTHVALFDKVSKFATKPNGIQWAVWSEHVSQVFHNQKSVIISLNKLVKIRLG
jgi:hypothetical protein